MVNIKDFRVKKTLLSVLFVLLASFLLYIIVNCTYKASKVERDILSYSIKVKNSVEEIDKIFERSEVNINLLSESILNSYDAKQLQNKGYNLNYVKNLDGLIRSVLANTPGVDGVWFQINATLPFSVSAYSWYGIRDNEFVNIKNELETNNIDDRQITPQDDPYYFNALVSSNPVWSNVYTDADTKKSMITLSSPVYKDTELVGVAGIDISTDALQGALLNMQAILGRCELFLFDTKDKLVLAQLDNNSENVKVDYKFLDLLKSNKSEPVQYYDNFKKITAILIPLSNNYNLVIAFDDVALFSNLYSLFIIVYVLFIALIVLLVKMLLNYKQSAIIENTESVNDTESISEVDSDSDSTVDE